LAFDLDALTGKTSVLEFTPDTSSAGSTQLANGGGVGDALTAHIYWAFGEFTAFAVEGKVHLVLRSG
jgi:hypothetical protein